MRILFTGSSSFTGYWFICSLVAAGHEVVATFQGDGKSYNGMRAKRVALIEKQCRTVFECPMGSDRFIQLLDSSSWDVLCHHAADVTDYKSPKFDALAALQKNTHNLPTVLELLSKSCRKVVLTGSVFEQTEGVGSDPDRAFSPYGLSKGLTSDYFRYYCLAQNIALGKFVITNPFGPYEEPRLTSYLVNAWAKRETPVIKTPDYVRDNIHVSLLAKVYADFVGNLNEKNTFSHCSPSGYVESQGAFVGRFAEAMRPRLELPCDVEVQRQESFPEPRMRINTQPIDGLAYGWEEKHAWDELASYYRAHIDLEAGNHG